MTYWLLIGLMLRLGSESQSEPRVAPRSLAPDSPAVELPAPNDSVRTRQRMMLHLSEFHLLWQHYWTLSETERRKMDISPGAAILRLGYIHCHPATLKSTVVRPAARVVPARDVSTRPFPHFPLIKSEKTWYAVCPTWLMVPSVANALDESRTRDGALLTVYRPALSVARAALLVRLDSAAKTYPADGWYTGQRVRLRIDQQDLVGARRVADECQSSDWWCAALLGHVLWRGGRLLDAEAAFAKMRQAMPTDIRCRWADIGTLLPPEDAALYRKLSCANRDPVHRTFWWLADPLFRQPGNERLVEQESRRVDIAMRQQIGDDERNVWDASRGGDAMAELLERYGWPSYTAWGGAATDTGHSRFLESYSSPAVKPYTSFEYSNDRAHYVAGWSAVNNPYAAEASAWQLFGTTSAKDTTDMHWPEEHMRVPRTVVQLHNSQTAFLRRQSHVIAVAAAGGDSMLRSSGASFDALMLRAADDMRTDSVAQQIVRGGETIVLRGEVSSEPAVFGIEAVALGGVPLEARMRFGATPPPMLSTMRAGEIALSEPIILDVRGKDFGANTPADTLLDHVAGSLRFPQSNRRIGVFWETYGVDAGDTVTVRVQVRRDEAITAAQRIGMALNLASDPNRPLEISWTEPDLQRGTRTLRGPVPVQQRFLVLNLEQLAVGRYILEVRIDRRGSVPAQSRRRVVLEP